MKKLSGNLPGFNQYLHYINNLPIINDKLQSLLRSMPDLMEQITGRMPGTSGENRNPASEAGIGGNGQIGKSRKPMDASDDKERTGGADGKYLSGEIETSGDIFVMGVSGEAAAGKDRTGTGMPGNNSGSKKTGRPTADYRGEGNARGRDNTGTSVENEVLKFNFSGEDFLKAIITSEILGKPKYIRYLESRNLSRKAGGNVGHQGTVGR